MRARSFVLEVVMTPLIWKLAALAGCHLIACWHRYGMPVLSFPAIRLKAQDAVLYPIAISRHF